MNAEAFSPECAHVYAAFAFHLLNPPDDAELAQAFFDRVAVSCSPAYVPLAEQCVRDARFADGRWSFGGMDGRHARHVAQCYEKTGFDYRQLQGCEPLARSLRPDSLATECAFMAFLLSECSAHDGRFAYADAFLLKHLATWVDRAALICAETGDDLVTRLVAECAAFVAEDAAAARRRCEAT